MINRGTPAMIAPRGVVVRGSAVLDRLGAEVAYTTVAGTAIGGSDFLAKSGTVTIPAGATSAVVSIVIRPDVAVEAAEVFTLKLSNGSGARVGRGAGTGRVLDDD